MCVDDSVWWADATIISVSLMLNECLWRGLWCCFVKVCRRHPSSNDCHTSFKYLCDSHISPFKESEIFCHRAALIQQNSEYGRPAVSAVHHLTQAIGSSAWDGYYHHPRVHIASLTAVLFHSERRVEKLCALSLNTSIDTSAVPPVDIQHTRWSNYTMPLY